MAKARSKPKGARSHAELRVLKKAAEVESQVDLNGERIADLFDMWRYTIASRAEIVRRLAVVDPQDRDAARASLRIFDEKLLRAVDDRAWKRLEALLRPPPKTEIACAVRDCETLLVVGEQSSRVVVHRIASVAKRMGVAPREYAPR